MSNTVVDFRDQSAFEKTYWHRHEAILRRHQVALGEISVFCGGDANSSTRTAYAKALELLKSGSFRRALVINTSENQRWALKIGREVSPEGQIGDDESRHAVYVWGTTKGELSRNMYHIQQLVEKQGFDVVFLNSWEMASCNSRLKEELLFRLWALLDMNVTVIVYSQATMKVYHPYKITRGVLGRLSGLAQVVAPLEEEEHTSMPSQEGSLNENGVTVSDAFVSEQGELNGRPLSPTPSPQALAERQQPNTVLQKEREKKMAVV